MTKFHELGARLKDPIYVEFIGRRYWQTAGKLFAWDEHNEVYLFWDTIDPDLADFNEGEEFTLEMLPK